MSHVRNLWRCEIFSIATGLTVKQMRPVSKRQAEKVARGANINLNHDRYEVRVVKCCWQCTERYSREGVDMPVENGVDWVAGFCSDSCAADYSAKAVKAVVDVPSGQRPGSDGFKP